MSQLKRNPNEMSDDGNTSAVEFKAHVQPIDNDRQWWMKFVPESNQWSDVNISRFLNIYKSHPILWDPTHSFYKDQPKRMKAYQIIAARLHLYGIKEKECIKLVESLKNMYMKERKIQSIAKSCNKKYKPPPKTWFRLLDDMIECVQRKLLNINTKGSVEAVPAKPWEMCCPRLYTEDIWTPKHFKTNVADWFLASQDEQLLCTCQNYYDTPFDDVCSTGSNSVDHDISLRNSSNKVNQCVTEGQPYSSETCCFNVNNSCPASITKCMVDKDSNASQMCDISKDKKSFSSQGKYSIPRSADPHVCRDEKMNSTREAQMHRISKNDCKSQSVRATDVNVARCTEESCGLNRWQDNLSKYDSKCNIEKVRHNKKLVLRKGNISEEECDAPNVCKDESSARALHISRRCMENITPRSGKENKSQIACENKNQTEPWCCRGKSESGEQWKTHYGSQIVNCNLQPGDQSSESCNVCIHRPRGHKKLPKNCNMQSTFTCGNESSSIFLKSETPSKKSYDTCYSNNNKAGLRASEHSSCASSQPPNSTPVSEKDLSDHRLDDHPDPTLCEKCAADRVPVPAVHRNAIYFQDPRMPELDKYCRYKDWDRIYNIRTQVPDEKSLTRIDENWSCMAGCIEDTPLRATRENHFPTEADVNIFTDPVASEARQVSLNNEYKREYGLNIPINRPRHYSCEVMSSPGYTPAQLIL